MFTIRFTSKIKWTVQMVILWLEENMLMNTSYITCSMKLGRVISFPSTHNSYIPVAPLLEVFHACILLLSCLNVPKDIQSPFPNKDWFRIVDMKVGFCSSWSFVILISSSIFTYLRMLDQNIAGIRMDLLTYTTTIGAFNVSLALFCKISYQSAKN